VFDDVREGRENIPLARGKALWLSNIMTMQGWGRRDKGRRRTFTMGGRTIAIAESRGRTTLSSGAAFLWGKGLLPFPRSACRFPFLSLWEMLSSTGRGGAVRTFLLKKTRPA